MGNERPRPAIFALAFGLALLTAAAFGGVARNQFVNYDDDLYVYANPAVNRGLTIDGLIGAFTSPHARNWHPLTTISHMVDRQIFGLSPTGPHLINVILHALTAAGLFLVLRAGTGSTWRSLVVAAFFALHPLRVESVAWMAERKDVLSGLLFVGTLAVYLHYVRDPSARRMFWVLVTYIFAVLAKPMVVTLPFVLLLLDYWPLRRFDRPGTPVAKLFLEKIPLFILAVLSCCATLWAASSGLRRAPVVPMAERLSSAAVAPWRYLGQIFWPFNLAAIYPNERIGVESAAAASLALLLVTVGFILVRRRAPYLLMGWFWFLGMLVPVIGIVQLGLHSHADRYTYLPSIGISIALVWSCARLFGRLRPVGMALAGATAIFLAWQTWLQVTVWHDSESLWRQALKVTRENSVAHNNLGSFYESRGEDAKAQAEYQEALLVVDHRPASRARLERASIETNLGNLKAKQGDAAGAEAEYRRALRAAPDFLGAHLNLANLFAGERDWTAALNEYDSALQIAPADAEALHRSGVVLMRLGRAEEASARFRAALEKDPRLAIAGVDLGNVLLTQGKIDEAALWYRRAAEADPKNGDASFNLGRIYLQQRRPADAIVAYQHAVAAAPNDPAAHLGLANALALSGAEGRAIAESEKALALEPDSVSILNNLAWLLSSTNDPSNGNPKRAIDLAEKAAALATEPNPIIYHTLAAAYASADRRDDAIAADEKCRQLAEASGDKTLVEAVSKELETLRKPSAPR